MLRRAVLLPGLVLAALVTSAGPALADDWWGSVGCDQNPYPGCELGAGKRGGGGSIPDHRGREGGPDRGEDHRGGGEGGRSSEDEDFANPDWNRADCTYERSDFQPPDGAQPVAFLAPPRAAARVESAVFSPSQETVVARPVAGPTPGESGAWYVYKCSGGAVRDALYRPPVWIPDAAQQPEGGTPLPSPAQLAEQARNQLRLPSPAIKASPAGEQLVRLPTWLWLDRGRWGAVSATASVPGVSVTAVARPRSVDWSMGDGRTVTCHGPGTPFAKGADPKRASPDCGHTYRASSAGQPDEAYPVSATVRWTVTWSGAGESGTFPNLTTTSTAAFRVAESQALNTRG